MTPQKRKAVKAPKRNRLIPVFPTVEVWVVTVCPDGVAQPLAVFAEKENCFQSCKLVGMSDPMQKPSYQPAWMTERDILELAKRIEMKRSAK